MKIRYDLVCRAGVILSGMSGDFLLAILKAKDAKARIQTAMPYTQLRLRLTYPNGARVPSADIKAALRALQDPKVQESMAKRLGADDTRSVDSAPSVLAVAEGNDFCQAGVVAPPDSLTGETRPEIWKGSAAGLDCVKAGV